MAIIYTYPLLDPIVGTELVIVSDSTAARNTRQTTIAALGAFFCALCPDTNTTYDLTGAGNVSDYDITLTGSDASSDIVKLVAGTDISLIDLGANQVQINSTATDLDTTYDLTAVQNAANADIILTPSVGVADIVKLVAGTNVTLTTLFNNVTIDVPHLVIEDEGVPLTPAGTTSIDFVGTGVTATTIGTDVTVTIPGGGGTPLDVKEEGVSVEANTVSIDFIGAGATAAALGAGAVSVTIPGGGGECCDLQDTLDMGASAVTGTWNQFSVHTNDGGADWQASINADPNNYKLQLELDNLASPGSDTAVLRLNNDIGGTLPTAHLSTYYAVGATNQQINLEGSGTGEITILNTNNSGGNNGEALMYSRGDGIVTLSTNDVALWANNITLDTTMRAIDLTSTGPAGTTSHMKLSGGGTIILDGDDVNNPLAAVGDTTINGDLLTAGPANIGDVHFRSLTSTDASVTITVAADTIDLSAGGGTEPTDFIPILVTQGIDGTSPLVGVDTVVSGGWGGYINRYATYSIIGSHVYIDFYLSWKVDAMPECVGAEFSETLGIAVGTGEESGNMTVAGLNTLAGMENLKTEKFNNAGIHITQAGFVDSDASAPDPDPSNWVSMPQGGKLNHFFNGSDSVAWLHWHRNMAAPGGTMQIDYSPDRYEGTQWWQCPNDPNVERIMWVAGSLNPIKYPDSYTLKWKYTPCNCEEIETIWSTLPLHTLEDDVIWVNCCFYDQWVQEWTAEPDTSAIYTPATVLHFGGGTNCESVVGSLGVSVEWVSCDDTSIIYTEPCCASPGGIPDPPGFYSGLVATGFDAPAPATCYRLMGPSGIAIDNGCSTITVADCDESPCI